MARLMQDGRVALGMREEKEIVVMLLELYRRGVWEVECGKVATGFLDWIWIYKDSLDIVIEMAKQNGVQFTEFDTSNMGGWYDRSIIKKSTPAADKLKMNTAWRTRVIERRAGLIRDGGIGLRLSEETLQTCFPSLGKVFNLREAMGMFEQEVVKMDHRHTNNIDFLKMNMDQLTQQNAQLLQEIALLKEKMNK